MKRTMILGIIRHALTFIGGLVVMKGWVSEDLSNEIIGGIMSLLGTVWSVFVKKDDE